MATDVNPYDFLIADLHQVDANHPGSCLVSLTSIDKGLAFIDKGLALGYSGVKNRSGATPSTNPTRVSAPSTIVEAQGWVIGPKGEVLLTAQAPTVTTHIPWLPPGRCHR